jgi:hypothetical protein
MKEAPHSRSWPLLPTTDFGTKKELSAASYLLNNDGLAILSNARCLDLKSDPESKIDARLSVCFSDCN